MRIREYRLPIIISITFLWIAQGYAAAQQSDTLPEAKMAAHYIPNEKGGSITIWWRLSEKDDVLSKYVILRNSLPFGVFEELGEVPAGGNEYLDEKEVTKGSSYYYMIKSVDKQGRAEYLGMFGPVRAILQQVEPVTDLTVLDTPHDSGDSITINWELSKDDAFITEYVILRNFQPFGSFEKVGDVPAGRGEYVDESNLVRGSSYYYMVKAVDNQGVTGYSGIVGPVEPIAQWFNWNYKFVGLAVIVFSAVVLYCIYHAKRGREFFIRRISGLDAADEAIGRATEMGKPILYLTGLGGVSNIATLAGLNILGHVARKAAEYDTPLLVPGCDPFVMVVEREIVKGAHIDAGRPDTYKPDNIYFVSDSQFAYVAAVNGVMLRELPAAIFYMGSFYAESLILAETGNSAGAMQIAGTDSETQLPFFVAACDYTLIGEELYAASAYLSREPLLLGSLKGQDWSKLALMAAIFVGVILELSGVHWISSFFHVP